MSTESTEPVVTKCKVDCACGWTDVFSKAYSGLMIECPDCGKAHRIPMFDSPDADADIDMSTMERLLADQAAPTARSVSVRFKPLFMVAVAFAVVVTAIGLPFLWSHWPINVALVGGAFAWPLAIAVAWLGQRRWLSRQTMSENTSD